MTEFLPCGPCPEDEQLLAASAIARQIGDELTSKAQVYRRMEETARRMYGEDLALGRGYADRWNQVDRRQADADQAALTATEWQEGQRSAADEVNAVACPASARTCPRLKRALASMADRFIDVARADILR